MVETVNSYSDELGRLVTPTRNCYFYGKLLNKHNLTLEQAYFRQLRALNNRLMVGAGVVCGLDVVVTNDGSRVRILPGMAIDYDGREIIVSSQSPPIDPRQPTDPCGEPMGNPIEGAGVVTLCLDYLECPAEPVPVLVGNCDTQNTCAPSMIRERYRVLVHEGERGANPVNPDLCQALVGSNSLGGFRVINTIEVDGTPVQLAASAQRVVVLSEPSDDHLIQVIDADSLDIIATFSDLAVETFGEVAIAADGGPALITSNSGIITVDIQADVPSLGPAFLTDQSYGPCAAVLGGTVLFAVNTETRQIDRIDVANQSVETSIETGDQPNEIIASNDNRWLYVTDLANNSLTRIDIETNTVSSSVETLPGQTLAVRSTAEESLAYVARDGTVSIVSEDDTINEFEIPANANDSAFTTDGQYYYVINLNTDANTGEAVIFFTEDDSLSEQARLPLGDQPSRLAIVPNRSRAFVTNTTSGTLSVIDRDRRLNLCQSMPATCPTPPEQSCIPVATIELLADGTMGAINICSHRPQLYSNAVLFEMILCLAERLDSCCNSP